LVKGASARRRRKWVEAIFSTFDKPKSSYKRNQKAQWKRDLTANPVSIFLFLQAFFIIISLFWLLYALQDYVSFGSQIYKTLFYYLSPIPLLSIGVTGLGLSVAWAIVNYQQDHRRQDFPIKATPKGNLADLSETNS
jgi:hypothetical protein